MIHDLREIIRHLKQVLEARRVFSLTISVYKLCKENN